MLKMENKTLKKSVMTILMCTVIVLNLYVSGPKKQAYAQAQMYPYDITIENILSDYIFFTNGELDARTHVVGGVAAKTAYMDSFGDGQTAPSYIETIGSISSFARGEWIKNMGMDVDDTLYYKNSDVELSPNMFKTAQQTDSPYIDLDGGMDQLKSESAQLAADGVEITEADMEDLDGRKYVKINVDDSENQYTMTYDTYKKLGMICFVNNDGDAATNDEVAHKKFTISITGVGENPISLNYNNYPSESDENELYFKLGVTMQDGLDFRKCVEGNQMGGQYNSEGTGFVLNLPDAKNVTADTMNGHVVAPNASVNLVNNPQGGVIAANIKMNNEAHFYPYSFRTIAPSQPEATTEEVVTEPEATTAEETTTEAPTTEAPTETTTEAPTTEAPTETTTEAQTTEAPTETTTEAPTTEAPEETTTEAPTTEAPTETTTEAPTTEAPTETPTETSTKEEVTTVTPATITPVETTSVAATTEASTTEAPTTETQPEITTEASTTETQPETTTEAPATEVPTETTEASTTETQPETTTVAPTTDSRENQVTTGAVENANRNPEETTVITQEEEVDDEDGDTVDVLGDEDKKVKDSAKDTTTPEETTAHQTTATSTESAKTGDQKQLPFYFALLLASAGAVVVFGRKKREN